MLHAILYSAIAGAMIPLGGWLAAREHIAPGWIAQEFRHGVIAFGGGALLAAVAFVLVPEGSENVSTLTAVATFALGGVAFAALDWWICQRSSDRSQLVAMLTDFLPEAAALGALLATGSGSALLLAGIIALQNLPEGFNAWREMNEDADHDSGRTLRIFGLLACLGPVAALIGHVLLSGQPVALGAIMCFAGGGILYLVFGDIAPQARLKQHWIPPLGAVAGFLLGMAGHLVLVG